MLMLNAFTFFHANITRLVMQQPPFFLDPFVLSQDKGDDIISFFTLEKREVMVFCIFLFAFLFTAKQCREMNSVMGQAAKATKQKRDFSI